MIHNLSRRRLRPTSALQFLKKGSSCWRQGGIARRSAIKLAGVDVLQVSGPNPFIVGEHVVDWHAQFDWGWQLAHVDVLQALVSFKSLSFKMGTVQGQVYRCALIAAAVLTFAGICRVEYCKFAV